MDACFRSLSKGRRYQLFVCAVVFLFIASFVLVGKQTRKNITYNILHGVIQKPEYLPVHNISDSGSIDEVQRCAYATYLSSTVDGGSDDLDADVYFIATRILVWQLLHDPATKTSTCDVVVIVGPDVTKSRCERLRKDGAIVRAVEPVHGRNDAWIVPKFSRWEGVMTKLRVWEMEEYSRILLLDGDMLLQTALDSVFDDPGAQLMHTKPGVGRLADEPELPSEYLLGGLGEVEDDKHSYPPKQWYTGWRSDVKAPGFFNAGFFLLKPDKKLFKYFLALLDLVDRFDPIYPEQNLLNYAFRWNGAMPWSEIAYTWNIRWATEADLKGGVASLHEKWWQEPRSRSSKVKEFFLSKRWQMEGYYKARDTV